jgi:hypothetical protein
MATPVQLAIFSIGAAAAGAAAYVLIQRRRTSPEERERRRRLAVNSRGRLIEGIVTEATDGTVFYSYSWRGIDYDCSQEVSSIPVLVSTDAGSLIGPVTIKFDPRSPYNSIVVCELWSGFPQQKTKRNPTTKEPK